MTRTHSRNPAVHREFDARLKGGGQRGDDVEKLTAATRKRLGARAFPEDARGPRTDTWSKNTADYVADALYALGAAPATVSAARNGRVTIGAQRMVRYPGLRNAEQLRLERKRAEEVQDRASEARKKAAAADRPKPPPVANNTVAAQRRRAAKAGAFALQHAGKAYTQGAGRWPISQGFDPDRGIMFRSADCSGFATAVVKYALGPGHPDVVNGQDWAAGYTGSMRVHGVSVNRGGYFYPGDCVIYGGGTGHHTAVCYREGTVQTSLWASHGSPGGPYAVHLDYRGDRSDVRRYIGV